MALLGLTASGKSDLALCLAEAYGAEIASVDSMQVYRGMDIGTAKPAPADQARIPHHLLDLASPETDYTVAEFQAAGRRVMADAQRRGARLILAGGSGLYFRALADPLEFPPGDPEIRRRVDELSDDRARAELLAADPEAPRHLDMANPRRVRRALEVVKMGGPPPSRRVRLKSARQVRDYQGGAPLLALGLDPGPALAGRAESRLERMLRAGLLEEVAGLDGKMGRNASQAVGYKQLLPVVRGEIPLREGQQRALSATMGLARRQRTFFRRDPRIRWLPWEEDVGGMCRSVRRLIEETEAQWIS